MSRDVEPMSDEGVAQAQRVVDAAYAAGNPSVYEIHTAKLLKRLDAIQSDREELHGRLLESSRRLLEIRSDRDALQAVVDRLAFVEKTLFALSRNDTMDLSDIDTSLEIVRAAIKEQRDKELDAI